MYTRLILLSFGPGMRTAVESTADAYAAMYKTMKGFRGATFFADYETGECGALTMWESKEDARVATASLWPQLQKLAGGMLKGPPTVRTFEVYEPKFYNYEEMAREG